MPPLPPSPATADPAGLHPEPGMNGEGEDRPARAGLLLVDGCEPPRSDGPGRLLASLAARAERLAGEAAEARERAAELDRANEALNRSVAQLTSHDSLDAFLQAVLLEVSQVSGAAAAKVFAHDPGTDSLHLVAMVMDGEVLDVAADPRAEVWRASVPARLTGGWDRLLSHAPIWIDAEAPPAAVWPEARAWHAAHGHRTVAVFPLIVGDAVTGGLSLSFTGAERPTEERVRICANLAGQAALAMRFTRLAAEARQAALLSAREEAARERARELAAHNAELRRRDQLLDALVRASTLLQESDDFDAAVGAALGVLGEAAGMDRVALLEFVDADGGPGLDRWRVGYEWCAPGVRLGCAGGPFTDLPAWRARIAGGETLLEARTRDLPDPGFREAMVAMGVRYTLTVAITADGAAWGGLAMDDCATDRPRTDAEKAVFAAAARAFGLAVRRRRALQREAEAERRLLVEREKAALRRGEALARAGTALQRAVDAVSRAADLDAVVPGVLDIVGSTFAARSCAYYEFGGDGTVYLRYWFVDGRTRRPHELLEVDGGRFGPMRELARGFRPPDEYLGHAARCPERRCVFVDHAEGTCMPEWDAFTRREGWEAELHVPLFVDGTPEAELVIYRGAAERYTPDEVALADTLGKQLALAMAAARMAGKAREAAVARERERAAEERAATLGRLNEALERRGRLLAAVSEVSRLLLSAGDPSAVFSGAVATLGSAAGVDRAELMVNRPPDAGSRRGYAELVAEWAAPGVPRRGDHPGARVIRWDDLGDALFERWIAGHAVVALDEHPEPLRAMQAAVGVRTQVAFPIFVHGGFWGSIGFDDCTGGRAWDEGELSALGVAATTIAGAVQRSRAEAAVVAAKERAAEERAAELARANEALVGSLDTLAGEADLDHFLVAVLRRIREASGAWAAHLFRYRDEDATLALHVAERGDGTWFGPAPDDPPLFHAPIPVGRSPGWAYMLETREIIVSSVDARDLFWPEAVAWHREHGYTALAALTLVAAGNPVGALGLAFRDGGDLQAARAELVQTLLTQLTLALRLTSLAETAREAAVAVERERAVQERAAELVRANRALSRSLARLGDGVDAEAFLRRVLQTITRQFEAPSSTLWLYDEERMEARLHLVCVGDRVVPGAESDHPNARCPAPLDRALLGYYRSSAERRVHVTDANDPSLSETQRAHLRACGAKAMVGVPLLLGERVLGLITVRIPEERPIRPEEREVAQALAHQATLALQLSRLAREARDAAVAQERERAAHARAAELARANDALRRTADRLAGEGRPGPLLDGMLQEITRAVAPADAAVYLRDAASGLLRLHAHVRGASEPSRGGGDGEWTPDEQGATEFLGRLLAEERDWALFDTASPAADARWEAKRVHLVEMGFSSAVSVVLRAGDEVLGLLTVGLRGRPPLNAEEAELVRALANQAALVLLLTRLGDRAREEARQSAVLGERNRIAREIHDTLAQGLTGIIFGLEGALRGAGETAEPVRRQVVAALDQARGSLAEARRSLWALRPLPLEAEGLEGALRRLVEQHRDGAVEIALEVVGNGDVHLPHAEAELGLLRVAQEAVSNALRHAGASRVAVRLERSDGEVRLAVADDGRGFDADALAPGQSFGLTGMRERAARAGGRIEIDSVPGRGTVVSVRVGGASP